MFNVESSLQRVWKARDRSLNVSTGRDYTDDHLVANAKAGSHAAFEIIIDHYAEQVYRLALRMLNNPDDARDIQQETFIRVMQQIHRFRGEAALSTWIYAITAKLCLSSHRHRQRHPCDVLEENFAADSGDPLQHVMQQEEREIIQRVLCQLAPADRLLIILKHIEGHDHKTIARILGCSEESSRSRLNRARKLFRALYQQE